MPRRGPQATRSRACARSAGCSTTRCAAGSSSTSGWCALGYYTGAVFEVYDPTLGVPIGGGGRYDALLGTFGASRPAVGFALDVERLHIALAGEERGTGALAR